MSNAPDLSSFETQDKQRAALTANDFAAAGVEAPNWKADPIPSLDTWRRWKAAEDRALLHKAGKVGAV